MTERSGILATIGELKLYGMKVAFDQIVGAAVKRQHEPQRMIGNFVATEVVEKQARSIEYPITLARLPLAKDVAKFRFDGAPLNETLVRDLATVNFLTQQRNVRLLGGTGTAKAHLVSPLRGTASATGRGGDSTPCWIW